MGPYEPAPMRPYGPKPNEVYFVTTIRDLYIIRDILIIPIIPIILIIPVIPILLNVPINPYIMLHFYSVMVAVSIV